MKPLIKSRKKIYFAKVALVIALLLFGMFLRFYKLEERTMFDADQEWLAFRADSLLKGDLALVGPVTSIGNFSIGPGFVYLWAIFSFLLKGDPVAGAYLSVILGVMGNLAIFIFAKKFISEKVAFILLFLSSVAFSFIKWDIHPWAPSLFLMSQTILLYGAYLATKDKKGYLLMAVGIVTGFQAHFGIVLSVLPILIYFLFFRPVRIDLKTAFLTLVILFIGFLPNLVFDIANNFINFKRLSEILRGDGNDYFVGFGKIINTLTDNVVPLVYPRKENAFDGVISKSIFAFMIVNGLKLIGDKRKRSLSVLLLLTIIIPSLFFYIQQGKFSEYYLMMTVPSLVLLLGLLVNELGQKNYLLIGVLIFTVITNILYWKDFSPKLNLRAKKEVVGYITDKSGTEGYGISLTTKFGYQFGFEYIFKYFGIKADIPPRKNETKIFTIVVPDGFDGINATKDFDGIGLIEQGI